LMYAARDDVGAVGAKLLDADNTIQHCFLITGAGEDKVAVHAGLGLPKDDYGYLDRIGFPQNVSAVTGACMLVNRNKFFEAGGFDEELPVAYNDVDLCLKLRKLGYVNVYTPYALLYHYESRSRGSDLTKENQIRLQKDGEYMRNKWGDFLKDPYYNSNFSTERQYVLK
ncbi:MAG: glycosyltransferase family 2 protein, partial [Butyrivibrio sp.]